MLYEKTDNILYNACKRSALVRIKTLKHDVLLCENFLTLDDDGNICFERIYNLSSGQMLHNIVIESDIIADIAFSFK